MGDGRRSRQLWGAVPTRLCGALWALAVGAAVLVAAPAAGWTPATQVTIAREGARLAPPDLYRQIERHQADLEEGALAPFGDDDPARHVKNADGSGRLDEVIAEEVERAVTAIEGHLPFERIVYQLGVVAHYVADANNPLNSSSSDAEESRYFADYLRYLERAEPRLPVVFYGLVPGLDERPDVAPVVDSALARGRELYPLVGREYRRIGFSSGVTRFDDRSTAFGVASLAFSHAVSDVGLVLRYIWVRAGGADFRSGLPELGGPVLRLPREGAPQAGAGAAAPRRPSAAAAGGRPDPPAEDRRPDPEAARRGAWDAGGAFGGSGAPGPREKR